MSNDSSQLLKLAEQIQQACIQAALEGYEHAGISGLCEEGRLEVAISEMRMLDLATLVKPFTGSD